MNSDLSAPGAAWDEIAPHLDAALEELSGPDRDVVLLRYFENKPAHEMAAILGISAEAAQKRVSRAVGKLRGNFAKRGIVAGTASGFAAALSANAVPAAPIGLAATISASAFGTTAVGTAAITTQIIAMTTIQKSLVAAGIALLAGFGIYQTVQVSQLQQQVQNLLPRTGMPSSPNANQPSAITESTLGIPQTNDRRQIRTSELERQNAALREERDMLQKSMEITKEQSEFLAKITMKLAGSDELQIPETVPEIAVLYGQIKMRSQEFYDKWNGRIPKEGTPEAEIYQQELDASVTDDATLMKAFGNLSNGDFMKDAAGMAQFQSLQLYGALGLDETQWRDLDKTLNRIYAEFNDEGLSKSSQPSTGMEDWAKRRDEKARQAFTEIEAGLTPQQRTRFNQAYQPNFLLGFSLGGQKPK